MAGTVDHISHGRFVLGIGAAWFHREHVAYGWTFPSMKERQDRLEEAARMLRRLFHDEAPVTHEGAYYALDDAPLSPGSYDEPIPILVGGTGERRTLRTLARYGDIMNLDGWAGAPMSREYFHHKVGVLNRHCEDAGRDPGEIKHTVLMPTMVTDDKAAVANFMANRKLGEGTAAGPEELRHRPDRRDRRCRRRRDHDRRHSDRRCRAIPARRRGNPVGIRLSNQRGSQRGDFRPTRGRDHDGIQGLLK